MDREKIVQQKNAVDILWGAVVCFNASRRRLESALLGDSGGGQNAEDGTFQIEMAVERG